MEARLFSDVTGRRQITISQVETEGGRAGGGKRGIAENSCGSHWILAATPLDPLSLAQGLSGLLHPSLHPKLLVMRSPNPFPALPFPFSLSHDPPRPPSFCVPPVLHSLRYLNVGVSKPSPGVPEFMVTGYMDGIPFVSYDNERNQMEPLTQWMKDGAEPGYWGTQTKIAEENQHVAARALDILREQYNQGEGLHTYQRVSGCDLLSDGSVRGSFWFGYDGRDFISFELGFKRFVAADNAAEITRRRWEGELNEVERWTNYLEHTCVEWLRKYVECGQKELECKEPPDVHVSRKEEYRRLILSCHAYGFYPRTITVNWMKGDEIWDQETEWGGIIPNSDGTFHTWARIEARPEEWEQYRRRVEHPGMLEPGIFSWEPKSGNLTLLVTLSIIGAVIAIVIGFGIWKLQSGRRQNSGYKLPARKDVGTNGLTAVQIT